MLKTMPQTTNATMTDSANEQNKLLSSTTPQKFHSQVFMYFMSINWHYNECNFGGDIYIL